jgi:Enoyl-(Acyl carrier protein) reductase
MGRATAFDCAKLAELAVSEFGRIDVLFNLAAKTHFSWLDDITDDDWDAARSDEVDLVLYLIRAAWPHLKATHGVVVNMASLNRSLLQAPPVAGSHNEQDRQRRPVSCVRRERVCDGHRPRGRRRNEGLVAPAAQQGGDLDVQRRHVPAARAANGSATQARFRVLDRRVRVPDDAGSSADNDAGGRIARRVEGPAGAAGRSASHRGIGRAGRGHSDRLPHRAAGPRRSDRARGPGSDHWHLGERGCARDRPADCRLPRAGRSDAAGGRSASRSQPDPPPLTARPRAAGTVRDLRVASTRRKGTTS